MGCDIHAHLEVFVEGKWEHAMQVIINRNYYLFGLMSGTRGEATPHVEPRGFPEDASVFTRIDFNSQKGDAHTPSWLTVEELAEIEKMYKTEADKYLKRPTPEYESIFNEDDCRNWFFGNDITSHLKYDDAIIPKEIEKIRLVFWFDN